MIVGITAVRTSRTLFSKTSRRNGRYIWSSHTWLHHPQIQLIYLLNKCYIVPFNIRIVLFWIFIWLLRFIEHETRVLIDPLTCLVLLRDDPPRVRYEFRPSSEAQIHLLNEFLLTSCNMFQRNWIKFWTSSKFSKLLQAWDSCIDRIPLEAIDDRIESYILSSNAAVCSTAKVGYKNGVEEKTYSDCCQHTGLYRQLLYLGPSLFH